jgi:hypothetical protein
LEVKKKILIIIALVVLGARDVISQNTNDDSSLKITGFIQVETKFTETENNGYESTFGVRRGFLKSTYTNAWGQAVLQVNATEKGIQLKDAYIMLQHPNVEWLSLKAGLFVRPFGYEISYSSSNREAPERVRVFTSIFPDERDLGVTLTLLTPNELPFGRLKFEFGFVNGNGIATENKAIYGNSHKDFAGHLTFNKSVDYVSFGIGVSYYNGKVMLFDGLNAYEMKSGNFQNMHLKGGDMINRSVYGIEGQFFGKTVLGNTAVRAEYLFGTQAGRINTNVSNSSAGYLHSSAAPSDVYLRPFTGAYLYFIQDIFSLKHAAIIRYDFYNPNHKLRGNNLQTDGDVKYATFGVGYMYNPTSYIRISTFYEWITNEQSNAATLSEKFQKNTKDNVFTIRLQYKF